MPLIPALRKQSLADVLWVAALWEVEAPLPSGFLLGEVRGMILSLVGQLGQALQEGQQQLNFGQLS